jgi:hypothetical protein
MMTHRTRSQIEFFGGVREVLVASSHDKHAESR